MLRTPSSSPRVALSTKTNTLDSSHPHDTLRAKPITFLPTPPVEKKLKRRIPVDESSPAKRFKPCKTYDEDTDSESEEEEDQYIMEDIASVQGRAMKNTTYQLHTRFISGPTTSCRRLGRECFYLPHSTRKLKCCSVHYSYPSFICLIEQSGYLQMPFSRTRYLFDPALCLLVLSR